MHFLERNICALMWPQGFLKYPVWLGNKRHFLFGRTAVMNIPCSLMPSGAPHNLVEKLSPCSCRVSATLRCFSQNPSEVIGTQAFCTLELTSFCHLWAVACQCTLLVPALHAVTPQSHPHGTPSPSWLCLQALGHVPSFSGPTLVLELLDSWTGKTPPHVANLLCQ